jgi:hypothetical protein
MRNGKVLVRNRIRIRESGPFTELRIRPDPALVSTGFWDDKNLFIFLNFVQPQEHFSQIFNLKTDVNVL